MTERLTLKPLRWSEFPFWVASVMGRLYSIDQRAQGPLIAHVQGDTLYEGDDIYAAKAAIEARALQDISDFVETRQWEPDERVGCSFFRDHMDGHADCYGLDVVCHLCPRFAHEMETKP